MDSNLLELLLGLSVQIRRSDGRVHAATVKTVDEDKSTAMVEWQQQKILQMKEIEISELCSLNPEIFDHLNTIKANASADPPPPKKYETRSRLSRIPAPSSFSTRSQARQTCLFPSSSSIKESPPPLPELQIHRPVAAPQAVLTKSEIPNQQRRRNQVNPAQLRPIVGHTVKENEEPDRIPPLAKGRKSVVSSELTKGSKRLSSAPRPPDAQTKKGKFLEASRPNQKFYEMIQEFRETLQIKTLSTSDQVDHQRICVCVRKRPLNSQELKKKEIDVVSVTGSGELLVHEPKQKVDLTKYLDHQTFNFDYSFDESATNDLVYKFTAKPLVASIFEGGVATCFAYGQTGSGKTHTMGGSFHGRQQNSSSGIYALAAQDVFTHLNHRKFSSLNVSVYVSFFEIYNGKVYDLLNKKSLLRVLEDERQQVQVVGLEEVCVSTAEDVIHMVQIGSACRTSGQTSANANSSRSHAVLQIALRRNDRACSLHGKFSLVDLAGNERGTDVSSNERTTMVETAEINRSLLALKECIRSLGMNSDHIPFRMSTLTKVLRDSFIGQKSKTCMIAMVAPGMSSCEYTMNTLRYADRVKELKGKSKDKNTVKAANFLEEKSSSEDEEESEDLSLYDPIFHTAELEEKVYNQLKKADEFVKEMEQMMFHLNKDFLPNLQEYSQNLLETVQALQDSQNLEQLKVKN